MTTDILRAAIEAALKRRGAIDDLDVTPSLTLLGSSTSTALVVLYGPDGVVIDVVARAGDDAKALRGVAFACGLRESPCPACDGRGRRAYGREVEDGCDECECAGVVVVDPAEEVARLTMALDDANNLASCQRDTIETLTRALHAAADRLGCADYDDACAAVADALDDAEKREREHVDEANALRMERGRHDVERLTRERDEARAALRAFAPTCASGAIATWSVRRNEAPTRCDACRRDTSVEHEHAAALRAAGGGR